MYNQYRTIIISISLGDYVWLVPKRANDVSTEIVPKIEINHSNKISYNNGVIMINTTFSSHGDRAGKYHKAFAGTTSKWLPFIYWYEKKLPKLASARPRETAKAHRLKLDESARHNDDNEKKYPTTTIINFHHGHLLHNLLAVWITFHARKNTLAKMKIPRETLFRAFAMEIWFKNTKDCEILFKS